MSMHELMPLLKSLWTVWFFAVFVFAVGWALWPSRRTVMEARARIPLDDDRPRQPGKGR